MPTAETTHEGGKGGGRHGYSPVSRLASSFSPPDARRPTMMNKLRQQVVRRCLSTRAVEWDAISAKLSDPRARAALDSLRNAHGEIQAEARKYVHEPEAIDFDYYRSVIKNKELVDAMEVRCVGLGLVTAHCAT